MGFFNAFLYKPRNVHFESQEENEEMYFLLRRHPITNLGWIITAIVMLFTPLIVIEVFQYTKFDSFQYFPAQYQVVMILLWYLFTLFYTFESFLIWYFNVYIITDKRLIDIDFRGFWKKRVSEATYDTVEDVSYETNHFWNILFDYGNIFMQTAAEKSEFEFASIPKPGIVHDKLTDLIESFKDEERHHHVK